MKEKQAEKIYKIILKDITDRIGHNKSTYSNELKNVCKQLMNKKFKGVYSADTIPKLKNNQNCIINLDNSDEPGSHWVALTKINNKLYFYDSFGRSKHTIMNNNKLKVINSDLDPEQRYDEKNCGQRCIAWNYLFYLYGPKVALLI